MIKVHGIKGTSFDINADQIGAQAKKLEDAAKNHDFDFINKNNPVFIDEAWKLVTDIEELLKKLEAEDPKPKKEKPDNEILLKFLTACKSFNMKEMDSAMSEIEKYQYLSDDGLSNWLRENLDKSNFTKLIEKLTIITDNPA